MAQKSKKNHIVASATPLFLEQGFKGTSIDMVVKASGVSKPTVYNHFPDKAALMQAVMASWIEGSKPAIAPVKNRDQLESWIRDRWLTDDAVRFYAIVIGEGWRFPLARDLFWEQFDRLWRRALAYLCDKLPQFDDTRFDAQLDSRLLQRLKKR